MSKKLRVLSGKNLVDLLQAYGFEIKRTAGSHLRLSLSRNAGTFHITVPLHKEIRKGTLLGIIRDLEEVIDKEQIEKDFYTK